MAKDLEQRFDAAMKKGERQDKAKAYSINGKETSKGKFELHERQKAIADTNRIKRSTSDGYMPRKESAIERSNRQVAKRNAGKTKDQISEEAFKSGRTSGRY